MFTKALIATAILALSSSVNAQRGGNWERHYATVEMDGVPAGMDVVHGMFAWQQKIHASRGPR